MMNTKGPWYYERLFRDAGNYPGDHYTIDNGFLTIIIVEEDFDPEKHDWAEVYGPNQEANARLIAAAPELLEALGGLLQIHAEDMNEAGFVPPVCECELCANAREAIRKAKGE